MDSVYCCWDCKHEWQARSTDRGDLFYDTHVYVCPVCSSKRFEERFPDGTVLQPYVPKVAAPKIAAKGRR